MKGRAATMKKQYQRPEACLVLAEGADILTTSGVIELLEDEFSFADD